MTQINPSCLSVKPLQAEMNITNFNCSEHELNEYLREMALRDQSEFYSLTKVVEYDGNIIGYFTLITDTISLKKKYISRDVIDQFSDYLYPKLPAVKIARLAVDKRYTHQGIGKYMITRILEIVGSIIKNVSFRIITVDAKKNAWGFYALHGFQPVMSQVDKDVIPMYLDVRYVKSVVAREKHPEK